MIAGDEFYDDETTSGPIEDKRPLVCAVCGIDLPDEAAARAHLNEALETERARVQSPYWRQRSAR